ncbi:MAG TPA: CDP-alcohol phosphatidyltransferase family protein [Mesorhizobium sp.]|jgi:CDP-diacylglycerol--glycerol-3-phosphate 3-phosphatidyltransferase|nr:CDP-alcohol phosphatidyltransferase family protein [Mesorhizobium sp.]
MPTLYQLKPAFQGRLRPLVNRLAAAGVTANQITLAAALLSVALGLLLFFRPEPKLFLLLPPFLLFRMALNAVDGMLAREHGQASKLGIYLNELGDLVSDAALALPFAALAPFGPWGVLFFIFAALLAEVAGILGAPAGIGRNYAGPLGKSDRAFAIAALGAWVGLGLPLTPTWAGWIFPALAALALLTLVNRIRAGL